MNLSSMAVFMVTAAVGYWVLTLAAKEGNPHARLGKWIGWGIIVISLAVILFQGVMGAFFPGFHGRGHSVFGPPGQGHGHGWGHGGTGGGEDGND